MTRGRWSLRLIPRRAPSLPTALAISAAALAASMLVRGGILGFDYALGLSVTTFPALMVATLYAGPRWGWLTLAAALAIAQLEPTTVRPAVSTFGLNAMFALSAALTVIVCSALRAALLRLDAANAAQAGVQKALETTEMRFRTLANSAPVLMWVTRADRQREFVNQAYVDFLGVSYDEALAFDWREVLHPEDLPRILKEQVAGESSLQRFELEARYRRHDGEHRWVRSISQPRWAPDGAFSGFIGVGYDVTDAKRAEADLKRINDLLAERVQAALAERDEAEAALRRAQKLEAVGQLTGGVAHDFNNLLTVVIGALDLMQRHPQDEARRDRMIEAALAAARRGERLTQQLLAFSRRQALRPEPVEVDAILRDSEPLLHRAVGEAVKLVMAPGAPQAVADLDPSQFEAAVMNLVVNARDATPAGGMIRIETLAVTLAAGEVEELDAGEYLCVAVQDTGCGMDEATLARAFEPFFSTKPAGRGTGLGLSQVYGFARQSGGAAAVDSAPGKGTCVRLYLPRRPVGAAPAAVEPPAEAPAGRARRAPALEVLLVEDDAQVGDLIEALLQDLGHQVRRAADAAEALAALRRGLAPDLLLTDVIMPGDRTGVDLAREATALRPGLPVILSSGYAGEVLSAAEAAPWPLLRKPYGAEALAHAIDEALQAKVAPV